MCSSNIQTVEVMFVIINEQVLELLFSITYLRLQKGPINKIMIIQLMILLREVPAYTISETTIRIYNTTAKVTLKYDRKAWVLSKTVKDWLQCKQYFHNLYWVV